MKTILVILLLFFNINTSFAGGEGHGGNHVKTRILWAREIALRVLKVPSCKESFGLHPCQLMSKKLSRAILIWRREFDDPLTVYFNGVTQAVTARTTTHVEGQIEIDLGSANEANLLELIVLMLHEAGHVIGLSDNLITDTRVIRIMINEPELTAIANVIHNKTIQKDNISIDGIKSWSKMSLDFLYSYLILAKNQTTSKGEIQVLLDGLEQLQKVSSPEYFPFLIPSVVSAEGDMQAVLLDSDKAYTLRKYYSFAIEDISVISTNQISEPKLTQWINQILNRIRRLAFNAKTQREEIHILRRTLERILLLLSLSSFENSFLNCISNYVDSHLNNEISLENDVIRLDYFRSVFRELQWKVNQMECSD